MVNQLPAPRSAVHVLATSFEATRIALTTAAPLANGSASPLIVLVPRVISYQLPLDEHGDGGEFIVQRYRDMVRGFGGGQVRLCVCRRLDDLVRQVLPPCATVVIAGRAGGWLRGGPAKLARRLTALGHRVVFVPVSARTSFTSELEQNPVVRVLRGLRGESL